MWCFPFSFLVPSYFVTLDGKWRDRGHNAPSIADKVDSGDSKQRTGTSFCLIIIFLNSVRIVNVLSALK